MTITPEQLAEWKRIEQEATKAPWSISNSDGDGNIVMSAVPVGYDREMDYNPIYGVCRACSDDGYADNLTFIATSRTAMPALIAEVERLRKIEQAALEWHEVRTDKLPADLDGLDVAISIYAIKEAERKLDAILTKEDAK